MGLSYVFCLFSESKAGYFGITYCKPFAKLNFQTVLHIFSFSRTSYYTSANKEKQITG